MTETASPTPEIIATLRAYLADVQAKIAQAAKDASRDPADITLIAVSKMQPEERILASLLAGQRVFGENRVQEAEGRWPAYRERFSDLHLKDGKGYTALGAAEACNQKETAKLLRSMMVL